jgi:hypothetical protein
LRSCIGLLGSAKRYDAERLDAACARALALATRACASVAASLKKVQEKKTMRDSETEHPSLFHETMRAPGYDH